MALPIVVALMMVSALLVTGVTAASLSAVGSATSSRASVQSQASAEAGLAAAQASIMAGSLLCSFPSTVAGLAYSVQVQYGSAITGAPSCSAPTGATTAVTASTAVIVSTGSAAIRGTQGNASGDNRRLQGVMTLTSTTTTPPSTSTSTSPSTQPSTSGAFASAVYVGAGGTSTSGNWTLNNGSGTSGGLYVNGTLTCSQISVNGPTVVAGDASFNGGDCRFGQDVTVSHNLNQCTGTTITGRLTVLGTLPGWMGGCATNGGTAATGSVPQESMPAVTASTYGSATTWAALSQQLYTAHGPTQWAETRFASLQCSITAPPTVRQDSSGDSLNGPIDAPASVKVIDARACDTLTLRDATIVLSGDLTIVAKNFYSTTGLRVQKAASVAAGTTPTLRIVVPMADGTSTCAANSSAGQVKVDSGTMALGSDVSLLLYSAGTIDMSNSFSFYGQMYGCKISELKNSVTVNYRSVGTAAAATSSSSGTTQAAVFGGKSVDLGQQNHVNESRSGASDALVYAGSNGFSCANNTTIQGQVWSRGTASYANSCTSAGTRSSSSNPPPSWTFPTLLSRQSTGSNPLDDWRNQGWTVEIFTGSNACSSAISYLKQAKDGTTAAGASWRSSPLLVVVQGCSSALSLDSDSALVPGKTFTLYNDLALMSDSGVTDGGPLTIQSSTTGQQRDLYWLVPSDTPNKTTSSCSATMSPAKIQQVTDVQWMMFTPCDLTISSNVGSSSAPVVGALYGGGDVSLSKLEFRAAAMTVPGLSGGGVSTTTTGSTSSSTPSSTPSPATTAAGTTTSTWSLTDVRDLAKS